MDGSPSSIVTMGFSTGSFSPVVGLVVTLGFGIGVSSPVTLIGQWSNVERIAADRTRVAIHADRQRIEVRG